MIDQPIMLIIQIAVILFICTRGVGAYKRFMITDPLFKVLGPETDKYQNFKMFDPDGECLRNLKEDLIGRIGIEAISILQDIIFGSNNTTMSTMMGNRWLD